MPQRVPLRFRLCRTARKMRSTIGWKTRSAEPGRKPALERLSALKGDASMRRFWRAVIRSGPNTAAPDSAIAVDLGPDDLPLYVRALDLVPGPLREPPFVNVHRLMERIGVAVPALYGAAPAERRLLVEDVGDLSLYEAVKADPAQASATLPPGAGRTAQTAHQRNRNRRSRLYRVFDRL